MDVRKTHLRTPWPPNDRQVGVVLVAHSMGGFVAVDTLFRVLNDRHAAGGPASRPMFPLIKGILAFDTPFNGLARSMFVYGAFSNYSKVSNVFNVMTAVAAAAPASIAKLGLKQSAKRAATSASRTTTRSSSSNPAAFATWQLLAVKTGTVGAIAAGGVLAYTHRKQILSGLSSVRANLNRDSVAAGYQSSVDALGQGLAYVNRGNVGKSFAWLAEHFAFVGALLRQAELGRRLDRMAALRGLGIADCYASMGENGYWSGGYFVPERTFCAVPAAESDAASLFLRTVIEDADDEIAAHMSMFKPDKNKNYATMTAQAAQLAVRWFDDDAQLWDDSRFALAPAEPEGEDAVAAAVEGGAGEMLDPEKVAAEILGDDSASIPDEPSPVDIAAAASLVPLPEDMEPGDEIAAAALVPLPDDIEDEITAEGTEGDKSAAAAQKQAYMRYLFGVAQQTGTNLRSYLPSGRLPTMERMSESMPRVSMPMSMPNVSMPNVSMPSVSMPGVGLFSKKSTVGAEQTAQARGQEEKNKEGESCVEEKGTVESAAE